jgi:hypothetical protein
VALAAFSSLGRLVQLLALAQPQLEVLSARR